MRTFFGFRSERPRKKTESDSSSGDQLERFIERLLVFINAAGRLDERIGVLNCNRRISGVVPHAAAGESNSKFLVSAHSGEKQ